MKAVFADTFYFLALLSPADSGHAKAVAFTQSFAGRMVTSDWVLTELADALAFTAQSRTEFLTTYDDLLADPDVVVVHGEPSLFQLGIDLYGRRLDKQWSLTDCLSFAIMQREGITEALTADHHFEQAGFVALLK